MASIRRDSGEAFQELPKGRLGGIKTLHQGRSAILILPQVRIGGICLGAVSASTRIARNRMYPRKDWRFPRNLGS